MDDKVFLKSLLVNNILEIRNTRFCRNNDELCINVYFNINDVDKEKEDIKYQVKERFFKPSEISEEYNIEDGRAINVIAIFLGMIEENGIKKYNNCGYNIKNGADAFISEKYKNDSKVYERLYYTEKGYNKIIDFIEDRKWRIKYFEEEGNLSDNEKRIYNFLKKVDKNVM